MQTDRTRVITRWRRKPLTTLTACALAVLVAAGSTGIGRPTPAAGAAASLEHDASTSTPGAVSVLDPRYGLTGDALADPDATPAFSHAIADALAAPRTFGPGPGASAQAVVYVPPGTYRLNGLAMRSDVRLEVDAAAVLEPVVPTHELTAADPISLITFGTHSATDQVRNVSVVAVGSAPGTALKARADPVYPGWDLGDHFTVDLDPRDTGAANDYGFVVLINVVGFEISGVYLVQNDQRPECTIKSSSVCPVSRGPYPSPTTARAALVFKPSNQSGRAPAGPLIDPTDGTVRDVYTVGGPYGFGPTQVAAGHDLVFRDIFSDGGTALRIETDDTNNRVYGGEVRGLTAQHIVGRNCNRALSLSAHKQANYDVHVTDVTAVSCNNALVQASEGVHSGGTFVDSSVDGLTAVGGTGAQVPSPVERGSWETGAAVQPVKVSPGSLPWSANVTGFACSGTFAAESDPFTIDGRPRQRPAPCAASGAGESYSGFVP